MFAGRKIMPNLKRIICFVSGAAFLLSGAACSASTIPSAQIGATAAARTVNPPASTPTAAANPCISGECAPAGDLPGWRQIFLDDFEGTVNPGAWSGCTLDPIVCGGLPEPYRSKWWAFAEGWTDNANGVYSPSKVISVAGGVLDIFIHTESGVHRVAAPVPLIHGPDGTLGQLYGRYVIRFQADKLPGYKIAWLLWPDSETWPRDGEIDFPEGNLDGNICAFMHRQDGAAGNDADGFYSGVPVSSGWHTAAIEWKRDTVRFILDGQVLGASTERLPNSAMHWVLEAATNLDGYDPEDAVSGHIQIDWVAAYAVG